MEQSYNQVKHSLGWAQYQVGSDLGMRRHWQLVCCAFSLCWWQESRVPQRSDQPDEGQITAGDDPATPQVAGRGENGEQTVEASTTAVVAGGTQRGEVVAGALGNAVAILERVVQTAPTTTATAVA